jgi:hypothetical protein
VESARLPRLADATPEPPPPTSKQDLMKNTKNLGALPLPSGPSPSLCVSSPKKSPNPSLISFNTKEKLKSAFSSDKNRVFESTDVQKRPSLRELEERMKVAPAIEINGEKTKWKKGPAEKSFENETTFKRAGSAEHLQVKKSDLSRPDSVPVSNAPASSVVEGETETTNRPESATQVSHLRLENISPSPQHNRPLSERTFDSPSGSGGDGEEISVSRSCCYCV